jgi:hypothetical protein
VRLGQDSESRQGIGGIIAELDRTGFPSMTHTQAEENSIEKDYVFTFAGGSLIRLACLCRSILMSEGLNDLTFDLDELRF